MYTRSRMLITIIVLLSSASITKAQQPIGLPSTIFQEVTRPDLIPPGSYVQAAEWAAASPAYSHQIGRMVDDPQAAEGKAWEAAPGDKAGEALLYGPYVSLPPGDYVAFMRIERTGSSDDNTVAVIDASVDSGQSLLNARSLPLQELPRNRYVESPLGFHTPGGKLEVRLHWSGYCPLRVDNVTVYKVTGASMSNLMELVPQPVETPTPNNLKPVYEKRPFKYNFPQSKSPAKTLLVVDLTHLDPSMQLLMLSLEGLVNRKKPEIYCLYAPTDMFWLQWMKKRGWIEGWKSVTDPLSLLKRYRSFYHGLVINDPNLPASKNIATMLAGVDNLLVASPSLAKHLPIPIAADLRGKWKTNVSAYRWAFDHLWPQLNHHVIACTDSDQLGLRDYLIENKVFLFWLSGRIDGALPGANPQAEMDLMEQLLARMPVNIPVMSYPYNGKDVGVGEGPGVTLFAEFGKYLVGTIDCTNLSVHSGISLPAFHQLHAHIPPLNNKKIYVSWIMSDGDNLPVLTTGDFPQLWKSSVRGRLPVGWTMSPSAWTLIPDVVSYYYRTASPDDQFVGAVSGVGYTYPDSYGIRYRPPYREQVFDGFLKQTAHYYSKMDMVDAWIMGVSKDSLITRYAQEIPDLQGIFPDYGARVSSYGSATYPTIRNVPVFHAVTNQSENFTDAQQIAAMVSQVKAITPKQRPAFLHLFATNWFSSLPMMEAVIKKLGPDYIAVRPDQLTGLYRKYLTEERVLARIPAEAVAIQGSPFRMHCIIQNVTDTPMRITMKVESGLKKPFAKLSHNSFLPDIPYEAIVGGIPYGTGVTLEVKGRNVTHTVRLPIHIINSDQILGGLQGLEGADGNPPILQFVAHYNAVSLGHLIGEETVDSKAHAGVAWAVSGKENQPVHALYGPYITVPAGNYLALYRIERIGPGSGTAVEFDPCVGGGKIVLTTKSVDSSELPEDRYVYIPVLFHHPGGQLETRAIPVGDTPLHFDSVDIWSYP